jgi:hypothetical protein
MDELKFIIFAAMILGYSAVGLGLIVLGCYKVLNLGDILAKRRKSSVFERPVNRQAWTRAIWHEQLRPEIRILKQSRSTSGQIALY